MVDPRHARLELVPPLPGIFQDMMASVVRAGASPAIERTGQRLGLKPRRLAADTAYGTGKLRGWLAGAGIAPAGKLLKTTGGRPRALRDHAERPTSIKRWTPSPPRQ